MAIGKINGVSNLTAEQIKTALLSLPDNERKFIITDPSTNQNKIIAIRRNEVGNMEYDYETESE